MNKHRFLLMINLILSSLSSLSASPLLSQHHQIYEHNYIYNSIDRHTYIDSVSQHNLSESTTNHRTSTPHKLLQNHNYDSSQNFHDKQANVMAFESSGASLQNWLSLDRPGRGGSQFDNNPWIAFGQRHKGWTNGDGFFSKSYGYYNQGSRFKYSTWRLGISGRRVAKGVGQVAHKLNPFRFTSNQLKGKIGEFKLH